MYHYTIHTGEQRCSPTPYSPPPSPPKSEIWSTTMPTMKNNMTYKTYSHGKTHEQQVSNNGAFSYYPPYNNFNANAPQHSFCYDTQHYPKAYETWKRQQSITNDTVSQPTRVNESQPENNLQVVEKSRKELSRMSIGFMLDDSRDEKYVDTTPSPTDSVATDQEAELGKEIDRRVYAGRKRRGRKNPYPMRAPSKDAPGINLVVDAYTPVMKDPAAILRSNETSAAASPTESVGLQTFFGDQSLPMSLPLFESLEDKRSSDVKVENKTLKEQKRPREVRRRGTGIVKPERKRKGNSLARVMTDRGLLESVFNTHITSTDIKSVRIPPPPSMQHHELMASINDLIIDHDVLNNYTPDISWKGQPLNINHLPHYEELHETEAKVVSILRLTPVQYLTGKHTLVSAARRYAQRALPFKKSDAQKLLRIDVNKASKLWEFFHRLQWI